ncbi:MAG TPA: glycosyltransferase family 9 protein [Flavitalea sp.]|nr:glycosyltransferase family 9 protein [Flavitalea sp.]
MLPKEKIKTIAIFRALQLGDLLCSVPAFRALRCAFPDAHIAIIGLPWMNALVERFPNYLDEFILFPGYPGLPEQPVNAAATAAFLLEMTKRKFDLVLQMQGNGSIVNPMIELFGATFTGGFCVKDDYRPASPYFFEYPEGISEVLRHLSLMKHLGIETTGEELEFPVTSKDEDDLMNSFELPDNHFICVHAGSRGAYRQWPTGYFAGVADQCMEYGYNIVLTGTKEELPVVYSVAEKMKYKPLIAAGSTNLGAMAALLKHSGGLISNCTGVSHVASALNIKSVIISMDGEPERWAPLNKELHTIVDWTRKPDYNKVRQSVFEQFSLVSSC